MIRRSVSCLLLVLAALTFATPAPAQKATDGRSTFEAAPAYAGNAARALRRDLYNGKENFEPKDKDHQTAVKLMACECVYPIYWDAAKTYEPELFVKTVENFSIRIGYLSRVKGETNLRLKTTKLQQAFCREVIDRCAEIANSSDKISKASSRPLVNLNAAILLSRIPEDRLERGTLRSEKDWADEVQPRLGEGVADHLVNTCVALLKAEAAKKDGPNDGARYYLFRTIANTLAVPPLPKKEPFVTKDVEEKAVALAIEFVNKTPKFLKSTPREEIEGYKALRREAIKVIAASRTADLGDKGHPALILAKYAVNDEGLGLEPRLDERLEAAKGLCRLVSLAANSPDLKIDYAAWCAAWAVYDFAKAANDNVDKKGLERARRWMIDATLLLEGVEKLTQSKNAFATGAAKQCNEVLLSVQGNKTAAADNFGEWVQNPPDSKSISKDETAAVKPMGMKAK